MSPRSIVLSALVVVASAALTPPSPAHAAGPELKLEVHRPEADINSAKGDIDFVRMHDCSSGTTDYDVSDTVELVGGWTLDIDAGAWCSVTVFWDSELIITGGAPPASFELSYDESVTDVDVDDSEDLTPFTVVNGFVYGGNPQISSSVD